MSTNNPSVNEIFDPERVDDIYAQPADERAQALALDRGTNYGVVRLTLLEHIYEQLYMQRISIPDESKWRARIVSNRTVRSASQTQDSGLLLKLGQTIETHAGCEEEELEVDYVFTATGYARNAHEAMLEGVKELLIEEGKWDVARDYRVRWREGTVGEGAGVWLQGCNEKTHGVSSSSFSFFLTHVLKWLLMCHS